MSFDHGVDHLPTNSVQKEIDFGMVLVESWNANREQMRTVNFFGLLRGFCRVNMRGFQAICSSI